MQGRRGENFGRIGWLQGRHDNLLGVIPIPTVEIRFQVLQKGSLGYACRQAGFSSIADELRIALAAAVDHRQSWGLRLLRRDILTV
jgi:hypothetical protein